MSKEDGIWVLCDPQGWIISADADWDYARREFEASAHVLISDIGNDVDLLQDFGMRVAVGEGTNLIFSYEVE